MSDPIVPSGNTLQRLVDAVSSPIVVVVFIGNDELSDLAAS